MVSMPTATYGSEAILEGQNWLLDGFDKLTEVIGRTVAGKFSTAKGGDAVRAADVLPTRPALERRRDRLLATTLAAPPLTTKRALLPPPASDGSSRRLL